MCHMWCLQKVFPFEKTARIGRDIFGIAPVERHVFGGPYLESSTSSAFGGTFSDVVCMAHRPRADWHRSATSNGCPNQNLGPLRYSQLSSLWGPKPQQTILEITIRRLEKKKTSAELRTADDEAMAEAATLSKRSATNFEPLETHHVWRQTTGNQPLSAAIFRQPTCKSMNCYGYREAVFFCFHSFNHMEFWRCLKDNCAENSGESNCVCPSKSCTKSNSDSWVPCVSLCLLAVNELQNDLASPEMDQVSPRLSVMNCDCCVRRRLTAIQDDFGTNKSDQTDLPETADHQI